MQECSAVLGDMHPVAGVLGTLWYGLLRQNSTDSQNACQAVSSAFLTALRPTVPATEGNVQNKRFEPGGSQKICEHHNDDKSSLFVFEPGEKP